MLIPFKKHPQNKHQKKTKKGDEPEEVITYRGTKELKKVWKTIKTSDIRKYSLKVPQHKIPLLYFYILQFYIHNHLKGAP